MHLRGSDRQRRVGFLFIALILSNHGVQVAANIAGQSGSQRTFDDAAEAPVITPQKESSAESRHEGSQIHGDLFAQPEDVVFALADSAGAARKLQGDPAPPEVITSELNYDRTSFSFTFINDIESPLQCQPTDCQPTATGIYAGVTISQVEILVDPDVFNAPAAKFRVVRDIVDKAGAQAGECRMGNYDTGAHIAVVNAPWAELGAATITIGSGGGLMIKTDPATYIPLTFKMGGIFHLCYSDDGSFMEAHADIVPQRIEVYGVFDDRPECATDLTCLTEREYHCFLLREAYNNMEDEYNGSTSCVVDYSYEGAGFTGLPGKGSWTGEFLSSYDEDGKVDNVAGRTCGSVAATHFPAPFLCNADGSCGDGISRSPYITPNASVDFKRIHLPPGRNDLSDGGSFKAYTVAACYCPDFQRCDTYNPDYVQQIGILHFYVSKVCPNGFEAVACALDFTGAAPQHRFAVRVECPSDACEFNDQNRVKVVMQEARNNLPSWDPNSGCGKSVHGINKLGVKVLPDYDNPDVDTMHGGFRQDYKLWNFKNSSSGLIFDAKTSGFLFMMGFTDFELRSRYSGETFDVCYCDMDCKMDSNWFKVGQLRFAPLQLVSAASNISTSQDEFIIEYMNKPGTFGFYRPWVDYRVMGLQEGGALKLVSDPGVNLTDAGCVTATYDRNLIEESNGLRLLNAATTYKGVTDTSRDVNKLIFNGGDITNTITVKKAGFLAICYCARPAADNPGVCQHDHWVLANRITIRGPGPGQSWRFSTHVVFRIEYFGWGLAKDDKIRIIPSTSECSDVKGNPRAAWGVTNIKVGCPHPCSEVGEINDVLNGDISVSVLSDDAFQCDDQNADCRHNDIKEIKVLSPNVTELEFEGKPMMETGDLITIGENIACAPGQTETVCNEERLAVVRGRYMLADRIDNHNSAPNEYISGHMITLDPENKKKVTIPIGWPEPVPKFLVEYKNAKRGRWTRHSKAITKQEIMGEKERLDMKICWKYTPAMGEAGPVPQHVAEVGTLTLIDPNTMSECIISLTTLVKKQQTPFAPFILSFRTATAETGKRYTSVEGQTRLRIYFVRTVALYVTFTDGATIEYNQGEDEIFEARQYVCGKLFKELWSSDSVYGFPMPRGCYYRTYGQVQELNLLFDRKNGLNPGQYYQVVLSGVAMDEATRDGEYAHIFTTDDVDKAPYTAIERGIAKLYRSPQDAAYGSQGVRFFSPDGVQISSGSGTEMLELKGGTELKLQLKGDPMGGGIGASSILRLYLWPLTQWDVANSCTVYCIPFDQVTSPCGAVQDCKGDAIIPNFQQNFLRLVLPSTMATMTDQVIHSFVFPELDLPKGGFFSSRLAAQISKPDDTKPHYTESVGDYIYKLPDEGVGVGKLVEHYGDGDQMPFRGDRMNVIYANIVLAATLFAAVQTGDAYMTLTLPPGYECVRTRDIDGESPWRAEDTLGVFMDNIPQGTGSPDEGGGTRGWSVDGNTCVYTLRQNAVIYAGSSLFIRVTVNNPEEAIQRMDINNRWQVNLTSKGHHQYFVTFPSVVFKTTVGNYSANIAVLGKIEDALIVPSLWQYSEGGVLQSSGYLRIFFKTEQGTGVKASIHVEAPPDFSFTPCEVRDLEDYYYVDPGRGLRGTRRLPGIVDCEDRSYPYNHAAIKLTGSLLPETFYAFELWCTNSEVYHWTHREGWRIFTLDQYDYRVDGTPETTETLKTTATSLPMLINSTMHSFGLYRAAVNTPGITNVQVFMPNPTPYSMFGDRVTVKVLPLKVSETISSTLRVTAPMGYEWDFSDEEFKYLAPFPNTTESLWVKEATGNLPGGVPMREGNVLLWPEEYLYENSEIYGFETFIRVPDRTPTSSPNEFLFEFGYEGDSLETRHAAGGVPALPVRALTNAEVEYETNVESKVNLLAFQVELVTEVPFGGGLLINGPPGFVFPETCSPEVAPKARGSTYQVGPMESHVKTLPPDIACRFSLSSEANPSARLRLQAGTNGIGPGLYRFQLLGKNPVTVMTNPLDGSTLCNYTYCWDFFSVKDLSDPRSILDVPISVKSFEINTKIVEALLPPLTLAQQAATLRDDRPLSRNPLVFAFKLSNNALFPGFITIRGPLGTIFREDCGEDVEVRPTEVFGTGQALPIEYAEWPQGVEVVSCRGEGPDARIFINPGITEGLQKELLYPFRIAVLHNPLTQPADNRWTFDYNGESSDPFQGFMLWKFVRTSLLTATAGTSTQVTGADYFKNPVTITFRPKNTVRGAGMIIKVQAPPLWQIARETAGECKIMIQPVSIDASGFSNADPDTAPEPNYIGPPSLIWGDADVRCEVDDETSRVLTGTVLASEREITGNRDYQLTIFVRNPTVAVGGNEVNPLNVWKLDTFDSPTFSGILPTFRDSVTLPGFAVFPKANEFRVINQDALGTVYRNGLQDIPGLYVNFKLPNKLVNGDVITVEAPEGFIFYHERRNPLLCRNFRWEPLEKAAQYLPNSNITCGERTVRMEVSEPKNIPEERNMEFRLDSRNPAKTPHTMLNQWIITHTLGATGAIQSTQAMKGWIVVPQLSEVKVILVGERKAESSMSTIAVSFKPVSDADELFLKARAPAAFDFTGATATSLGHEVIATAVEAIRVRASMFAAVTVDIVITDFRLGLFGGDTVFDLITKLNNGEEMDEMLSFTGGFRLPGRVSVSSTRISSKFKLEPEIYPVPSLWEVRMGEEALVEIPFTTTMTASAGTMIRLRAPPYDLKAEGWAIIQSGTAETITSEVISAASGELVARLSMAIFAGTLYEIKVNVMTPKVPNPTDAMWTVEVLDGGQLPLNTNDGLTEGFRLVDKAELQVAASRSPPLAEIDADLIFDPQSVQPDELLIVAPAGFNFTQDCLVESGEFNQVKSCEFFGNVAGRAAALLTTDRLTGLLQFVTIRITTPSENPESSSWFVNAMDSQSGLQLGWGEDEQGVIVRQMLGARVIYPGIPSISGQMAFKFITSEKLEAGGSIRVGYPPSIEINCAGAYLFKVALEGQVNCVNAIKEGYFELQLGRPLPPGQQAFAVTSTCPSAVAENFFYIIVYTNTGQVADAAMSIPGLRIQHGLALASMPLIWGTAEPKRATTVSMGIELLGELPLKDPPIMSEIIVQLPTDFTQQVRKSSHVESLTNPLPQRPGGWLDVSNPSRLRLLLDDSQMGKLPIAAYRFQFPIVIPSAMPKYNVWEITVCSPAVGNESCTGPTDPRALVSFPLAGFAMGETHPSSITQSQTGAATRHGVLRALVPVLLWSALRHLWRA